MQCVQAENCGWYYRYSVNRIESRLGKLCEDVIKRDAQKRHAVLFGSVRACMWASQGHPTIGCRCELLLLSHLWWTHSLHLSGLYVWELILLIVFRYNTRTSFNLCSPALNVKVIHCKSEKLILCKDMWPQTVHLWINSCVVNVRFNTGKRLYNILLQF